MEGGVREVGAKSLRKGKAFEREVAKLLGRKIAGDERVFRRMPLQGRRLEEFEGDVIVNADPEIPENGRKLAREFLRKYLVDAKDWKGWTLDGLLLSEKHVVWEWWHDLDSMARRVGKKPFLVFKLRGKMWVMMRKEEWPFPEREMEVRMFDRKVAIFPADELEQGSVSEGEMEAQEVRKIMKEKGEGCGIA